MSRNQLLLVVTLLACAGAALSVWIIGSLDKQGNPHVGLDPVIAVPLFLPYVMIAGVAVWNGKRGIVISACLLAVTAIAALSISIAWSDYDSWRHTPSGREFQRMAILRILLVQWVGSGALLALATGYRLVTARKPSAAPPGPAADRDGASK